MAVDDTWTACFRDCCGSRDVNLAVPKREFAGNLRQIHDGPASAVYLGRFGDKAIAVKKPKLPTKVRGGDVSIACIHRACAPTTHLSRLHSKCSLQTCVHLSMETSL